MNLFSEETQTKVIEWLLKVFQFEKLEQKVEDIVRDVINRKKP